MEINKKELRKQIEMQIQTLTNKAAALKDLTQAIAPDDAIGRVSRMDAINNKSINEAALRQSQLKLSKLKEALTHIDKPEFGKCVKCGKPIPSGRIILMPESKICVECANRK